MTFSAADKSADEHVRTIVLTNDRVVLRRAVRGIKMAVNLPVNAYLGVALRMEPGAANDAGAVAIVLEHRDPALSLPLYSAPHGHDIIAEWHCWGRALRMPLLVAGPDGSLHEAFDRIGAVRVAAPVRRRRRRTVVQRRRPSQPLRRRVGNALLAPIVHRGEREIIARH